MLSTTGVSIGTRRARKGYVPASQPSAKTAGADFPNKKIVLSLARINYRAYNTSMTAAQKATVQRLANLGELVVPAGNLRPVSLEAVRRGQGTDRPVVVEVYADGRAHLADGRHRVAVVGERRAPGAMAIVRVYSPSGRVTLRFERWLSRSAGGPVS